MNALVSRRALLGATAALGALALPSLAVAGNPAAPRSGTGLPLALGIAAVIPPADLDAELFRLIDAWAPALAAAEQEEERSGIPGDRGSITRIFAEVNAVDDAIEAHAPRTAAGLAAKARWMLGRYPDQDAPLDLFLCQVAAFGGAAS